MADGLNAATKDASGDERDTLEPKFRCTGSLSSLTAALHSLENT